MDPMTDPLDREIARALDVAPSREFVARVRMRIAAEPAPATWSLRWVLGAAAMAAAGVVAVVMMRPVPRVAPPEASLLASRAVAFTPVVPELRTKYVERRTANQKPRATNSEPRTNLEPRTLNPEPLAVFDPREVAALRRLVAAPIPVAPERPAMELESVSEIVIQPLAIAPLEPGGQGERQ